MKTLIFSMTCGEGHNTIAKAIKNAIEMKGEQCQICQLYGFSEKEIARQNKMFLRACKFIPHIYGAVWNRMRKKPFKGYINGVVKDCYDYVLEKIEAYQPDVIVCTHNNAGAVISKLKKEGKLNKVKTYSIVFDYCICPYWESNTSIDYIVLPHEDMEDEMLVKGFKADQLLPFGLTVDEKYTKKLDKRKVREELGLEKDIFTVVLYSGGNCLSSAYKLIKQLEKCKTQIQIIAICGHNKKEFNRIEEYIKKTGRKNILNLSFCDYLDKVFSAGDIVFSRGGGMGLTEQINKHIPFVLREKLIINEKINKYLFAQKGMAIAMEKLSQAANIVDTLASNYSKLQEMIRREEEYCKPNATENLVNHILENN